MARRGGFWARAWAPAPRLHERAGPQPPPPPPPPGGAGPPGGPPPRPAGPATVQHAHRQDVLPAPIEQGGGERIVTVRAPAPCLADLLSVHKCLVGVVHLAQFQHDGSIVGMTAGPSRWEREARAVPCLSVVVG